jgi:hypothetical protein
MKLPLFERKNKNNTYRTASKFTFRNCKNYKLTKYGKKFTKLEIRGLKLTKLGERKCTTILFSFLKFGIRSKSQLI